jgi:NAD(P)-dependent dehydrogenase (short-subunit alcohol dehydrogenase family)
VTRLILADLNDEGLEETAEQLTAMGDGIIVQAVKTDTSNQESIQNMVDQGVARFGAIHYCVNCAGISTPVRTRSTDLDVECWDRVVNINLRGVWLCMRSQIEQMLKQPADLTMR